MIDYSPDLRRWTVERRGILAEAAVASVRLPLGRPSGSMSFRVRRESP